METLIHLRASIPFNSFGLENIQMKSFVQITRHLYEEPYHMNLVIIACNERAVGSLEFYTNTDRLLQFGQELSDFPNHQRSNCRFELGSEYPEDRFAFYLRLRAQAMNSTEKCLLQLRLNNNQSYDRYTVFEDPQSTEFSIRTNAKRMQHLGRLLTEFSKLKHQRLFWSSSEGILDNELQFKDRQAGDNLAAAWSSLPKIL